MPMKPFDGRSIKHHMRYALLIMIAFSCFTSSAPGESQDRLPTESWMKQHESEYAKQMSGVSPRIDGWMIGIAVRSDMGRVLSFDRDDDVPTTVTLINFQLGNDPPALNPSEATMTLFIKSDDGNRELAQARIPVTDMPWSGGPPSRYMSQSPWTGTFVMDLRSTIAGLPDGRYQITCEWPAGERHPKLTTSPTQIQLGKVTIEEARTAANATGGSKELVSLVVDEKTLGRSTLRATLTNKADRPIEFTAHTDERQVSDAGRKTWTPLHSMDVFKPDGWHPVPTGWCGTGAGAVVVHPGNSANLELIGLSLDNDICRARITWRYTNEEGDSTKASAAVSDPYLLSRKKDQP